jgi:PAS domain S-box-containing protein
MENLPACAYIKDEQGRHIFVNAALATQTMTTVGSLLGKANGDLWPKDIAAKLDSADAAVITSRSSLTIEEDVLMNNEVRTYLTTKFPIERSNGGTFLAGISLDITERKQAEAELEQHRNHLEKLVFTRTAELTQARDTAEAANRAKTIFLANMSHELRTPMNGIMGMNDIALRQTSEPKIKHYLTRVKSASSKLLAIINDILDISRIEAGQMKLQHVEFKLSRVIENLTNLVGIKADEKGLKLDIKVPIELENLLLIGDPLRLEQILLNLICNAIKFTSEGAITVSVSLTEDRPKLVALRFAVQDTGIGISEEDQKRIFLPFEQADGSMTRQYGGTGLGLAIGKDLAKLMDGDIGIESKLGAGSTFWLAVRFKRVEEHPLENPITASDAEVLILQSHKGRRVLVVDDDATSQAIAQVQLDGVGLAVDTAESGEEAISMAKQTDYAAILMDIRMANMDGLETTRRIRQLPGRKQTPILALTANAYSEDEENCLVAGMNGFIAKPYDESTLFSTMLKWLDRGAV